MALQKNIKLTDNFGIEVEIPNTYIKVKTTECSKENSVYILEFKKSKDSNDCIKTQVGRFNLDLNSSENPIKQAYIHIKTLPEFSDAIDC